eukprot:764866-Hanusia_phi.AAC.4
MYEMSTLGDLFFNCLQPHVQASLIDLPSLLPSLPHPHPFSIPVSRPACLPASLPPSLPVTFGRADVIRAISYLDLFSYICFLFFMACIWSVNIQIAHRDAHRHLQEESEENRQGFQVNVLLALRLYCYGLKSARAHYSGTNRGMQAPALKFLSSCHTSQNHFATRVQHRNANQSVNGTALVSANGHTSANGKSLNGSHNGARSGHVPQHGEDAGNDSALLDMSVEPQPVKTMEDGEAEESKPRGEEGTRKKKSKRSSSRGPEGSPEPRPSSSASKVGAVLVARVAG